MPIDYGHEYDRRYFGGVPDMPPPPPPPPKPLAADSSDEEAALARQRKAREAARMGRSQLVIPKEGGSSGLRIL